MRLAIQAETVGAGGYTNKGNNAQTGTTTSLTLATNDDSTEAEILGLRLNYYKRKRCWTVWICYWI